MTDLDKYQARIEPWERIRDHIEAMKELDDGPLHSTVDRAVELLLALLSCDWPNPISATTRRSLGADSDDGITLTWRGSSANPFLTLSSSKVPSRGPDARGMADNTFSDITVWDERDT